MLSIESRDLCDDDSSATTFIGQDFGASPQEIRRAVLTGTVSYGFNASVQYSDDSTNWTDTGVTIDVPPFSSVAMNVDIDTFGTHQYWRFLDLGGYGYMQIGSAEMRACN